MTLRAPSHAVIIGGLGCLVGAAVFALRLPMLGRAAHPIYVRKGLAGDVVVADDPADVDCQQYRL